MKDKLDVKNESITKDDIITGWFRYEIWIFFAWIGSSMFFLFYSFFFKVMSKVKENKEKLGLGSIWNTKNSMDYFHFHKYEFNNFNLIAAPLVYDLVQGWTMEHD